MGGHSTITGFIIYCHNTTFLLVPLEKLIRTLVQRIHKSVSGRVEMCRPSLGSVKLFSCCSSFLNSTPEGENAQAKNKVNMPLEKSPQPGSALKYLSRAVNCQSNPYLPPLPFFKCFKCYFYKTLLIEKAKEITISVSLT